VPVGRTYDPATNLGWEGTGVSPDVAVPAEQALDEALRRAGVDPKLQRPLGPGQGSRAAGAATGGASPPPQAPGA
jgi:hypothetical protein